MKYVNTSLFFIVSFLSGLTFAGDNLVKVTLERSDFQQHLNVAEKISSKMAMSKESIGNVVTEKGGGNEEALINNINLDPIAKKVVNPIVNELNNSESESVSENIYHRVDSGDMLSSISKKYKNVLGGQSFDRQDQIYELNKDKFINGDRNHLKKGAILVIPKPTSIVIVNQPVTEIEQHIESVSTVAWMPPKNNKSVNEIEVISTNNSIQALPFLLDDRQEPSEPSVDTVITPEVIAVSSMNINSSWSSWLPKKRKQIVDVLNPIIDEEINYEATR